MTDVFEMIAVQRSALADVLASLNEHEWQTPSLCAGWTVRDVAGHLSMPFKLGKLSLVIRVVKAGGNYNKVADLYAREAAAAPTSTLVATLRANASSHFTPPGLGPGAPLTDVVVHGLDVGIPLGRRPDLPNEAAVAVLDFLTSRQATRGFVPKGLTFGLSFEASDMHWSAGSGLSVKGSAESLILALTGRHIGLEGLSGEGIADLRSRAA